MRADEGKGKWGGARSAAAEARLVDESHRQQRDHPQADQAGGAQRQALALAGREEAEAAEDDARGGQKHAVQRGGARQRGAAGGADDDTAGLRGRGKWGWVRRSRGGRS